MSIDKSALQSSIGERRMHITAFPFALKNLDKEKDIGKPNLPELR